MPGSAFAPGLCAFRDGRLRCRLRLRKRGRLAGLGDHDEPHKCAIDDLDVPEGADRRTQRQPCVALLDGRDPELVGCSDDNAIKHDHAGCREVNGVQHREMGATGDDTLCGFPVLRNRQNSGAVHATRVPTFRDTALARRKSDADGVGYHPVGKRNDLHFRGTVIASTASAGIQEGKYGASQEFAHGVVLSSWGWPACLATRHQVRQGR